jgi:gliding motility-associated-like protein
MKLRCISSSIAFLLLIFHVNAQSGMWTWMNGSSAPNPTPNYGTQGVPSLFNQPPGTYEAAEWTDLNGNFWLFGGGDGSLLVHQSALWKYDPTAGIWTWMKGPSSLNAAGVYGTQGISSPTNYPGARAWGAITWTDINGSLWLLGGFGHDALGNLDGLNDLWKYDISVNEWTWMKGSNIGGGIGNFGTLQISAITNTPPARYETSVGWVDNNSNLWLFGGSSNSDDMWKYDKSTNLWTWMSGQSTGFISSNHGILGVASTSNTPGSRSVYAHWKDRQGNFWLYGGAGNNTTYADMWMYNPSSNVWTWMAGSSLPYPDDTATFTQQCIVSDGRPSKSMENRACWTDACGRFWSFGGSEFDTQSPQNTLWMFDPSILKFTWVNGSLFSNPSGVFGTQNIASSSNVPPGLMGGNAFMGTNGELWLFGGGGYNLQLYNTLWRYQIDTICIQPGTLPPSVIITSSESGCVPFEPQLNVYGTPGTNYHWDFGDPDLTNDTSNSVITAWIYDQPGTYTITLTTSGSSICRSSDTSIIITAYPNPDLGADAVLCNGSNITLNAGIPGIYSWSTGDTVASISIDQPGTYSVQVTNANVQCSDTIVLSGGAGNSLRPINIFSPNGDGVNDCFDIGDPISDDFSLEIFDRWGKRVFITLNPSVKWNGVVKQSEVAEGVYYWIATYMNCEGQLQQEKGFVHVAR